MRSKDQPSRRGSRSGYLPVYYKYEYRCPVAIDGPLARDWFWRLMNHVRAKPYIERFACAHYLKKGASTEKT